jgi:beta-glucanase (GH16 family)
MGNPVGNPAQGGVEVDVMEYHSRWKDECQHALHWDGYGKDHKSQGKKVTAEGLHEGFHTFGVLWTKVKYTLFVDGKQTWETDKVVSAVPEYALLSLEVGKWAGDIGKAELPDSGVVDYVRWYAPAAEADR